MNSPRSGRLPAFRTRRFGTTLALVILAGFWVPLEAQTNRNDIPKPPAEALARLDPFLGEYNQTMDYAGQDWAGTIGVRPAVKGWYVEWEINTVSGPIDRQLRLLMTWGRHVEQFRVWRFETLDPLPAGTDEGVARLEADELVMEWSMPAPDGSPGTFRNRVRMQGSDTLVIVTEGQPDGGEVHRIGVTTAVRNR